ncbi:MAG TPA: hypothetical protein VLD36_02105 [Burkholderiales bacterium]|jgi:hypothetical protein|nr:hypothetical protein [Burkholderiales bacterium]
MESILNNFADLFFWGSAALLVWGAVLTLGEMFAAGKRRSWTPAEHAQNQPRGRLAH